MIDHEIEDVSSERLGYSIKTFMKTVEWQKVV